MTTITEGEKHGHLIAGKAIKPGCSTRFYLCVCGKTIKAPESYIASGRVTSCGCMRGKVIDVEKMRRLGKIGRRKGKVAKHVIKNPVFIPILGFHVPENIFSFGYVS